MAPTTPGAVHTVLDWDTDGDGGRLAVRALARTVWDDLVDRHPAGPRSPVPWDPATFLPALVAASTGLDLADAAGLVDDVDLGGPVVDACLQASAPTPGEWARLRRARDPLLTAEVAYCSSVGVPHSVFLGWAQRDRDLALAHADLQADRCPGCGAPGADRDDPTAWVPTAVSCPHCQALDAFREQIPELARPYTHPRLRVPLPGELED